MLVCRRHRMIGGSGGEMFSPILFDEKSDNKDENENDELILKFINPVVAKLFSWRNCKSACRVESAK